MKKHGAFKTVELILYILIAAGVLALIILRPGLYHQIAADSSMKLLCAALWAVMLVSFIFIFIDFSFFLGYRKEYREMDYAIHSDPVSGLANRFSCDMVVEQYLDKPLPADMGCIMLDISNIQDINRLYGHLQGNMAIRDFSNILQIASENLCFVGRNGGNKFLAIFENASSESMSLFLERVAEKTRAHNSNIKNGSIEYRYGTAFHEGADVKDITALIALSNSRITKR